MERGGSSRSTARRDAASRTMKSSWRRISRAKWGRSSVSSNGRSSLVVRVTICDVGPRDGLQNEPETLAPAVRAELVNRLGAAGIRRVEAASFVRADAVPQMAGAVEVVAAIERREGVEYSGLALNEKGYERLIAAGLDRV